jgi:putative ABC transport system permease protein
MAGGANVLVEGAEGPAEGELPFAYYGAVDDAFFATYGVRLRAGRLFDERDRADAEVPSVIVDATAAERLFAGRDPIGQRIKAEPSDPDSRWGMVVGVVEAMHLEDVDDDRESTILVPFRQEPERFVTIAAHVQGDAAAFGPRLAEIVRSVDADTPVYWLRTQERAVAMGRSGPDLMAKIFGTFGLLGLVLAAAGLYGVLAFSVEQRTREIGLRRAIGASERGVLRTIVARSVWQVAIGLAIGVALGIPWANVMASQFTEVDASSVLLFPLVGALIAIVALVAAVVPARRALRVDPMVALRHE